jgi:hypothetical protein
MYTLADDTHKDLKHGGVVFCLVNENLHWDIVH